MKLNKQTFKWLAKVLMLISIFAALPMSVQALSIGHCSMPSAAYDSSMMPMSVVDSDQHCDTDAIPMSQTSCAEQSCHCGHLFVKTALAVLIDNAKPTNHFQASFSLQHSPPQLLYRPPQLTLHS